MRPAYFITHGNVRIDPQVPVPDWSLSDLGRRRMTGALRQSWILDIASVYSSTERKSVEMAAILAAHLGLAVTQVHELGENDRSATGFLPPDEFEAHANEFFTRPAESVGGWERAVDAQARIVEAVRRIVAIDRSHGCIAIVSHGAVGTLLHCRLAGREIDRRHDQPANGGGNYFRFTIDPPSVDGDWRSIDPES
jgi:broad specificity phosphatase PhoE